VSLSFDLYCELAGGNKLQRFLDALTVAFLITAIIGLVGAMIGGHIGAALARRLRDRSLR
jgi:hypothetical protein